MTDLIDPPAPTIPRDKWDRPMVVPPGGGKPTAYTRATVFVDCLDDKYNLQRWQQRMVALGLAERPDLLLAVASTHRDDKPALDRLTGQAQEAARAHAAATTGTALHRLTEQMDRGQGLWVVPPAYQADLDAYAQATAKLDAVLIEQFVVNDALKIGGTPDRIVRYQGRAYVADLKTGSVDWGAGKFAMQLAVYAHSTPYDYRTAERTPYPCDVDQERGIIIHLPAGEGRCAMYWLDLAAGWEGVALAGQVRAWRRRGKLLTRWDSSTVVDKPVDTVDGDTQYQVGDSVTVAGIEFTKHAELADAYPAFQDGGKALALAQLAIGTATTLDELRTTYSRLVASGVDSDALLPQCLARKAELETGP